MRDVPSWLTGFGTLFLGLAAITGGLAVIGTKSVKLFKNHSFTNLLHALLKSRFTTAALTAVLIGALILVARPLIHAPCGGVNVSITSPRDGAVVNQSQLVFGTINHVCPGQHLWIVLQSGGAGGGGYYPQDEVAVASSAGSWSTTTYFGRASKVDDGRPFNLLAAVADDATSQQFSAYLASGNATHSFPALASLGNAAVLSEIAVIRGPYLGS